MILLCSRDQLLNEWGIAYFRPLPLSFKCSISLLLFALVLFDWHHEILPFHNLRFSLSSSSRWHCLSPSSALFFLVFPSCFALLIVLKQDMMYKLLQYFLLPQLPLSVLCFLSRPLTSPTSSFCAFYYLY